MFKFELIGAEYIKLRRHVFTRGILFCILLASPIERFYYALSAASNANFHDALIIPVISFTIFYHSPQESFVIKNECGVFFVFCGITTRKEKKISVPLAQLADLNGECFLLKNKIFSISLLIR